MDMDEQIFSPFRGRNGVPLQLRKGEKYAVQVL